jgi:hypothetical protein
MHNHTDTAQIVRMFASVIEWLRAGYPDEAPRTGYSPLLALNGPLSLTARQTDQIVDGLREALPDQVDIGVAITKVTNRPPTETQTRTVAHALNPTPPQE